MSGIWIRIYYAFINLCKLIYIALSIFCSTLIFIVFKGFGIWKVDTFKAIIINYLTAALLGVLYQGRGIELFTSLPAWNYLPIGLGLLFIALFFFMATSSQVIGVGPTSLAVKMSMVIAVLSGVWIYGDRLDGYHIAGIIGAVAALFLTYDFTTSSNSGRSGWHWPIILFFGSGAIDISMKYAQHHLLDESSMVPFTGSIFLFAAGYGFIRLIAIGDWRFGWRDVGAGIALGVPNFGSIYFLLRSLNWDAWSSAQIFAVNNVGIVFFSALSGWVFFREDGGWKRRLGMILALVSILLISKN